jgi:hypothetical protein
LRPLRSTVNNAAMDSLLRLRRAVVPAGFIRDVQRLAKLRRMAKNWREDLRANRTVMHGKERGRSARMKGIKTGRARPGALGSEIWPLAKG